MAGILERRISGLSRRFAGGTSAETRCCPQGSGGVENAIDSDSSANSLIDAPDREFLVGQTATSFLHAVPRLPGSRRGGHRTEAHPGWTSNTAVGVVSSLDTNGAISKSPRSGGWVASVQSEQQQMPHLPKLYSAPIGALLPTLDATFFALSDPKRRGVLERLGRGPATLSELARPSGLTLNGMKKHVGILELAGLVETEKVGRVRECRLGRAMTLEGAVDWIEAHRRAWEGRLDRFERFVECAE